jgi:prepilin-type processing-associated H-X9-DG protein
MKAGGTNGWGEIINVTSIAVVIYDWPGPNYFGFAAAPTSPHPSGGINAYFVDGHTAWLSAAECDMWKEGQHPFYKWGRYP